MIWRWFENLSSNPTFPNKLFPYTEIKHTKATSSTCLRVSTKKLDPHSLIQNIILELNKISTSKEKIFHFPKVLPSFLSPADKCHIFDTNPVHQIPMDCRKHTVIQTISRHSGS